MLSFLDTRIPGGRPDHGKEGEGPRTLRSESQALVPFISTARETQLQQEMCENTRNIAARAKAIQSKNTKRKYAAAQKEWTVRSLP
jgi:hypothetical protein